MFKLNKDRAKYDLRKFYFTNRVVNAWNSLPDHVVFSETVNTWFSTDHVGVLLPKIKKKIPKNTNGRLAIPALAGLLVITVRT